MSYYIAAKQDTPGTNDAATVRRGVIRRHAQPPRGFVRLLEHPGLLLPPIVSALHESFFAWGLAGYSPGPVTPERIWCTPQGHVAVAFDDRLTPQPLLQVGQAPDLAAWLVLLDKWMETYVIIARARTIWPPRELAGALTFLTPAFLPASLLAVAPDNWERVATALAIAVLDGPLKSDRPERSTSDGRHTTSVPNERKWRG